MRASADLHDKLAKQNDINRRRLSQELEKLEKVEKSDLRMIETQRQRFRSRYKKLEAPRNVVTSKPVNVRMYETHNPGFCYHCTGAIKESSPSNIESTTKDSYDLVRSLLFTDGEVDPEKVLCLHLLAPHTTKSCGVDDTNIKPVKYLSDQGKKRSFGGAWNNILPCYVIEISDTTNETAENVKLHEDPMKINLEDEAVRYFERKYARYVEENEDFGRTLTGNVKQTRNAPSGLGRMPIISPHVYSLLGASHEMRIKQEMMDGRRRFAPSNNDLDILVEESLSLRLDDTDGLSSRMTTRPSSKNWTVKPSFSYSRRMPHRGVNLDHRITMLRMGRDKSLEHSLLESKNSIVPRELVTIRSSYKAMRETISRSSSTKSHFYNMENISTTNSCISNSFPAGTEMRKYRKRIYLNSPMKNAELRNKYHRTVPILVNYQVEALVHSILEVLEQVSSEKLNKIIKLARDPEELSKLLIRPEIQAFIQSLMGQSLISSPESFVVSSATVADEIDLKFEEHLEKEVVALTLEVADLPGLNALITDIRNNIFTDSSKKESNDKKEKLNITPRNPKESELYAMVHESVSQNLDTGTIEAPQSSVPLNTHKRNYNTVVQNEPDEDDTSPSKKTSFLETSFRTSRNSIENYSKGKRQSLSEQSNQGSTTTTLKSHVSSKSRTSSQDSSHTDVDSIILRRMTNNQRILIGQTCASLKAKRINKEGLIDERMPLAALIAPAFSRDSIKALTRGTIYSNEKADVAIPESRDEEKQESSVPDKLTGPVLAKIRQEVAEEETKQRLMSFLQTPLE